MFNTTTVQKTGPPGKLRDFLLGSGRTGDAGLVFGLLGGRHGFDPSARASAFQRVFIDPNAITNLTNLYGSTVRGDYLTPSGNPHLQGWIDAVTERSQHALGQSLANLRSRFARSGQTTLSGPLMQAETQAITESNRNLEEILARALLGLYGEERQRQLAAGGALGQVQMLPYSMFSELAQMFQRGTTEAPKPSPFQMVLGALGGLGQGG